MAAWSDHGLLSGVEAYVAFKEADRAESVDGHGCTGAIVEIGEQGRGGIAVDGGGTGAGAFDSFTTFGGLVLLDLVVANEGGALDDLV